MASQSYIMWVHGHSVQIQSTGKVSTVYSKLPEKNLDQLSIERFGYFTRVKANEVDKTYWFHFSIPAPIRVGDEPLGVKSATIRFRTSHSNDQTSYMDVHVAAVHIYDAEVCIARYDNLDLKSGDWNNATMEFSFPKNLSFGLGVSVGVEFVGERSFNNIESGYIDFSGAGACFADPRLILAKQPYSSIFMVASAGQLTQEEPIEIDTGNTTKRPITPKKLPKIRHPQSKLNPPPRPPSMLLKKKSKS